jgi:glutathione peroxidase
MPCNQFGGQEPGTADEIANFCSLRYGEVVARFSPTTLPDGPEVVAAIEENLPS